MSDDVVAVVEYRVFATPDADQVQELLAHCEAFLAETRELWQRVRAAMGGTAPSPIS